MITTTHYGQPTTCYTCNIFTQITRDREEKDPKTIAHVRKHIMFTHKLGVLKSSIKPKAQGGNGWDILRGSLNYKII